MRIRMFSKIAVVLCLSMTMNSYDYINNNIVVIAKAETKKMQDDYTGYIIESKSVDMYNKMKANFSGKSENKNYNRSMRKNRLVKTERLSRKRLQSLQSNRDTYIEKDYIVKGGYGYENNKKRYAKYVSDRLYCCYNRGNKYFSK